MDYSFLWDEDLTEDEYIEGYQELIDSGMAWKLEGSVGRTAEDLIEQGLCMLGEERHKTYWGTTIPSRFDVVPGTKGSKEYMEANM